MKDYYINIFYSEEDGEYIAEIPDLAPCSVSGATPQKALEEVLIAKELSLEVALAEDLPGPEPTHPDRFPG